MFSRGWIFIKVSLSLNKAFIYSLIGPAALEALYIDYFSKESGFFYIVSSAWLYDAKVILLGSKLSIYSIIVLTDNTIFI